MPTSSTAEIFLDAVREKGIETALFLASDFRTGSTLIGKLLEMQTGLPFQRESFNTVPTWHVMQDAPLRRAVLAALGPVRVGCMGAKLMWPHRNNLARILGRNTTDAVPNFREIFPRARFVHVARRDKVAQGYPSIWRGTATFGHRCKLLETRAVRSPTISPRSTIISCISSCSRHCGQNSCLPPIQMRH